MKLVYICSPYAGDVENNVRFAKTVCHYAMKQGCAPVAVHLLYPQILNDAVPSERKAGIRMGLRVLASCEELWVCGGIISHGMSCEIAKAARLGIPVRYLSAEQIQSEAPVTETVFCWTMEKDASVFRAFPIPFAAHGSAGRFCRRIRRWKRRFSMTKA